MWPSIFVVIFFALLGIFVWAWMRFMDTVLPDSDNEDYMIGDDYTDWGDKS